MNSNYNSAGFHMKGPSVAVEPMMGPLNESPMQGLNFVSNRDQYGFQTHGHGDMLTMGVQPQHQLHMQGPFNHQAPNHEQHSHLYQDSVPSCLHGDRHMGFNSSNAGHPHMFEGGFGQQLAEAQSRECISQQQHQQRMAAMPEFQPHGHPNGNNAVPAPCLPLDQSPNRAASFHGLPSSSPETHRLEHYRLFPQGRMAGSEHCFPCDPLTGNFDMTGFSTPDNSEHKLPYCETGNQVAGGPFSTCNRTGSRGPMMGGSKVEQQLPQQNVFSDRFGNRGKIDPGVTARHHLMAQQRPGPVARQNPSSPALPRFYHTPDYVASNADVQSGGPMVHVQHGHLDRPIHRLNNHNMHPFGEPVFDVPQLAPQPPHHPHLSSLPYLNMAKRPRFDLPNGSAGESCSPLSNSLHNRPNLESHLSPSAFPSPMGDFTSHVTDGFPSGPLPLSSGPQQQQQQQQQRRQNAAMIIKQMASRSQQQRMRQPDLQQLSLHGDVTSNGMVCRGPLGSVSQSNFEKKHNNFHGNFDSPHLPQENSWFPEPQQHCRETNTHALEQAENGHNIIFRQGITSMDMQSLNSPGAHHPFENNVSNPLQMQSPDESNMQSDRRPAEFGGMAMRRQHSFPPGGPSQQGAPQSNPPGFSSSPGNYPAHPEYLSSQHLSVNKLGALSLGNLNKASTKDSVFGQSCLAALSTACQNMIASLGAPNLNVTFNKKSQNEAKRKAGQVEQDINSSGSGGPGAEYFQSNASQNSQTPCSGNNNNNTATGQSGTGQMAKREASTLSPNDNMESGCEGKMATGNGKGRGKKRRDSGHISPGNFSPPCGAGNPVVSPSQQGSALSIGLESRGKTPERSLVSPSFGKPDLATSMDSGIQSVGKSDGVSPCMDYLDEASPNYSTEDPRPCRAGVKCNSENRAGYSDAPCMDQVRTPLSNSGQDEVHPLEILQAQIQLQRQQFSISEDQPMGGKSGKKAECQAGLNGECALATSSPVTGKGSVNTIDLDSLMTEQHATWYVPGNKALIEDPSNDKCLGFWDRARGQSDNKEGHG
ncbi:transcriptional activator MN1 [Rhinichthys klamathensis goyatoka]|uniref:transcriptional activator MN1 n=1 Tax=Rhinichthys klamathensis goyatoka TaxID=3034132 RepID=UPI0024B57F75|nr:transcriptional activator MN1 [Rhinichthys klamathensis goyatoka]XP_056119113.1 transcriptional activator MN1 [Rhinichthys klamathensis goyatoka]